MANYNCYNINNKSTTATILPKMNRTYDKENSKYYGEPEGKLS